MDAQREVELKLELAKADLRKLRAAPAPPGFTAEPATTRALRSIYFDTPGHALRRAKWSLRVRRVGRKWVQTVKAGTGVTGGLSRPREAEAEVAGPAPDLTLIREPAMRQGLWQVIDGEPLAPAFETVMRRTTRVFRREGDETCIEMALDAGEIRAGEAVQPLFEAELELKSGDPAALFALAGSLPALAGARFSRLSKAGRGYALAAGDETGTAPVTACEAELPPWTGLAPAFRAILLSCMDQIAGNRDAVLERDDPEGPHQLRVGLRRLRSALKVHQPLIDADERRALDAAARDLALSVGELRDLDVLVEEIVEPAMAVARLGPDTALLDDAGLARRIEAERRAVRKALREQLAGPAVNALLFRLGALAHGAGWRQGGDEAPRTDMKTDMTPDTKAEAKPEATVGPFAAEALEKRWKAAARLAARIDKLTLEERHDLRKELKKLRYAVEFFRSAFPARKVKPFLARLKALQDVFGYLNDVVMAGKLAGLIAAGDRKPPVETALAAGFVLGWHEARAAHAFDNARALWDETRRARRFWRG
ncbi:CYTH and CHAD domain-containing protein [Stappia sp. TSB10GB4]|uniref:CYTH and CHAD domain-containing protein n=1 Tax=Stappia sp. TSB10GB4 TaxID=2003584 RepID=UPI001646A866|nr:CYTH and CHAD domain-containing protein [Stappia sp. TSB10GB4]